MGDAEKRRIAEVVAGAMFKGMRSDIPSRLAADLMSDDGNAWWAVMGFVKGLGWRWSKASTRKYWVLVSPNGKKKFYKGIDGERWARLSCVAQAIEAGVLK